MRETRSGTNANGRHIDDSDIKRIEYKAECVRVGIRRGKEVRVYGQINVIIPTPWMGVRNNVTVLQSLMQSLLLSERLFCRR